MAEKRRRGRAGKASYFVPAGNGSFVYTGPLYSLSPEANVTAKQADRRRLLIVIGITALSVLCGLLPVPGMSNTFYVIAPYALTLIFAAASLWKAARITYWGGDSLREYVYETTVMRLPLLKILCAVFAGISIAGESVFLVLEGIDQSDILYAIIFLVSHIVIFILSIIFIRIEKPLEWIKRGE